MQTKLQLRHVRRSQELRQRTGITYITSYFFLSLKLRRRNLQTQFPLWKRIKYFPSTLRWRNLQTPQSPFSFYLCLRNTRAGKPRDNPDVIILENLRLFYKMFSVHTNTTIRRYQIPLISWPFSWRNSVSCIPITEEILIKLSLKFSWVVWTMPTVSGYYIIKNLIYNCSLILTALYVQLIWTFDVWKATGFLSIDDTNFKHSRSEARDATLNIYWRNEETKNSF